MLFLNNTTGQMHTKHFTYNFPPTSKIHTLCESTQNMNGRTHTSQHTHRTHRTHNTYNKTGIISCIFSTHNNKEVAINNRRLDVCKLITRINNESGKNQEENLKISRDKHKWKHTVTKTCGMQWKPRWKPAAINTCMGKRKPLTLYLKEIFSKNILSPKLPEGGNSKKKSELKWVKWGL